MVFNGKKFAGIAIFFGNGIIILRGMIALLIIIFGLRTEVMSGASRQYPEGMLIAACFGAVFLLIFIAAHIFSLKKSGWWRWLIIACLLALLTVNLYEVIMAQSLDGLTRPILKKYMINSIFFSWIFFNYYYWFVIKKKPVIST